MCGVPVFFIFQGPLHPDADGAVLANLWKKISTDEEKQPKAEGKYRHDQRIRLNAHLHHMAQATADQRNHWHRPKHQQQHAWMLLRVGWVSQHEKQHQPVRGQQKEVVDIQLPQQQAIEQRWHDNNQRGEQQLFLIRLHLPFHGRSLPSALPARASLPPARMRSARNKCTCLRGGRGSSPHL